MQKNPTTIRVVAAALVGDNGQVLMHRRPIDKEHGGLWEFPGGKIELGETPHAALVRELREELGIEIDPAAVRAIATARDDRTGISIDLFLCHEWTGVPQCLEGEEIGWFAPAAVPRLSMPPLDLPLAQALLSAI